jgi:redox-sensing transcriptional repressor
VIVKKMTIAAHPPVMGKREPSMPRKDIPDVVVARLARYYRYFRSLLGCREKLSSQELATALRSSASQVRLDLSYFGGFGLQGYGYNVEALYREIGKILGVAEERRFLIIGAGSLGRAIANYPVFHEIGFRLVGILDIDPALFGRVIGGIPVRPMDELEACVRKEKPEIAVLTLPATAAQEVADRLVRVKGLRGILNFAPVDLLLPEGFPAEDIHLTDKLLALSYRISEGRAATSAPAAD